MAEYNINKITLPSGDICKINASITSTDDNNGNVVLEGVDASSSTPITGISMNGTLLGTSGVINIPAASSSSDGVITTEAQTFAGTKQFNNNVYIPALYITNTIANGASSPVFRFSNAPSANTEYARIFTAYENYGGAIRFREYSGTATARTSYYEQYQLPIPSAGRTSNGTYMIITDKDPVTSSNRLGVPNFGGYGTDLKAGDNVDTDLEMGHTYYSSTASVSATLAGTPPFTNSGFKMMQIRSYAAANYAFQLAFGPAESPRIRYRHTGSTWTAWGEILDSRSPVTIAQGGTGATTVAEAKENLGLGTAAMNFRVQNLNSTAAQQWMLKNNVVNSSNSHYGNSTAICVTNNGIFLGEWDSSTYLGSIWSIRPDDYVTLSESQTITGGKIFKNSLEISGEDSNNQVYINYIFDKHSDYLAGRIAFKETTGGAQASIREACTNTNGNYVSNPVIETYNFPAPTQGRTTGETYTVITTKNTKTLTASLTVAGWTTSHTQTVTVTGMTASANIIVSAAPASETVYRQNSVYCSAQAANTLTFTCASNPTSAITVQIFMIG